MTSFPSPIQPPTENSTNSSQPSPVLGNGYAPSVPISVYRELAAEMQANQALLEFLKTQNQQLIEQNQQLRQEIDQLAQSAVYLQQLANSFDPQVSYKLPQVKVQPPSPIEPRLESPSDPLAIPPESPDVTDKLFTEQQEIRDRRPSLPERELASRGSWLMIGAIVFVVVVFGGMAGFFVIRLLTK